ncbi:GntR family transcriptional regulator [Microvirga sp. M2]|uniref:GntR family transcriptional regulator n=1 Tax=Microvirga sp. M2 TaxID=3073270 RepID=UPI0039C0FDC2
MSETLSMQIAEQLKQLIYSGEFQPGDRLNEAALALRMNTSRGPIREAIRILSGFGLVTAVPRRGVFVRQMSVREMVEVSDLRALVFGFAAGLAAEQRTDKDCARLEEIVDGMDRAAEAGDKDLYYRLNLEFHHVVVSLARSERAERLYHDFVKELHLFRRRDFDNTGNMRKSNAEHRLIYDAIVAGNKADAVKHAEQHIFAGCQRMLRTMGTPYAGHGMQR